MLRWVSAIVLLGCLCAVGRAEDLERRVIEGVRPKSEDITTVAGVDLSEHGYQHIRQYALVDSNTLFVVGESEKGELLLASLDLKESKKSTVSKLGNAAGQRTTGLRMAVCYIRNLNPPVPYVVLSYEAPKVISNRSSETEAYVEIYRRGAGGHYSRVSRVKVGETNITFRRQTDVKYKYRYLAVDNSTEGPGDINPAKKSEARVLFLDGDRDGYTDLVVWQRTYLSKLIADKAKGDFALANEQALLMSFNVRQRGFSSPKTLAKMPFDKEFLWHVCFPSEKTFVVPVPADSEKPADPEKKD